jgi:hypothetical protein
MKHIWKAMAGALVAMVFVFPAVSSAQEATPGVTERQVEQQKRIGQGVRNGELTPAERRKLEREQRAVQADKKRAKADGKVTAAERRRLAREQAKANRDIARQKHDSQTR